MQCTDVSHKAGYASKLLKANKVMITTRESQTMEASIDAPETYTVASCYNY